MTDRVITVAVVAVGLHILAAVAHGLDHALIPVDVLAWQGALVVGSVILGPLAGLWLLLADRRRVGGAVLVLSLGVAFVFELVVHFLVSGSWNPDYVGHVAETRFTVTAVLAVVTDALGALAGAVCWATAR